MIREVDMNRKIDIISAKTVMRSDRGLLCSEGQREYILALILEVFNLLLK